MSANPLEGVDNTQGIFSAFDIEPTESPDDQESKNADVDQETVNPDKSDESELLHDESDESPADESSDDTSDQGGNDESQPKRVKAKLGDQEVEFELISGDVDLETFKTGLLTKKAFYEKSEELANERKEYEQRSSKLMQSVSELESLIAFEEQQLSEDIDELKSSDPHEYYLRKQKIDERKEKLDKFRAQVNDNFIKQESEFKKTELSKITTKIPEWLDDKVKATETKQISKMLVDEGFSADQVKGIYNSTLIKLFRKAWLYDRAKSKPLAPKKKAAPSHIASSSSAAKVKRAKSTEALFYGE